MKQIKFTKIHYSYFPETNKTEVVYEDKNRTYGALISFEDYIRTTYSTKKVKVIEIGVGTYSINIGGHIGYYDFSPIVTLPELNSLTTNEWLEYNINNL
jgi:hypothetical protein